jgi:hypothetical protein
LAASRGSAGATPQPPRWPRRCPSASKPAPVPPCPFASSASHS